MEKAWNYIKLAWNFIGVTLLAYGLLLFLKYNEPILKQGTIMGLFSLIVLFGIIVMSYGKKTLENKHLKFWNITLSLIVTIYVVMSLLNAVLFDFFQPLALYDEVIYLMIGGLVMILVYLLVHAIYAFIGGQVNIKSFAVMGLLSLFVLQFQLLEIFQTDFDYEYVIGQPIHVFESGEGGYEIFRIPTILVLEKGSKLSNGDTLDQDRVIVMAEARRNGSLDHGDIDLVQKISHDGGETWSDLMLVRSYEDGVGKIGNSTPIFDKNNGTIHLLHLAGAKPKDYKTYNMMSYDGGLTYSKPEFISEGIVGPGHGIMVVGGLYDGRLIAPGYHGGGSRSIYSDDQGETWQVSKTLPDGNEAEIAQLNDTLIMVVRTNIGVASKHEPLNKLYTLSEDGGASWSELYVMDDVKEPICMSSIVENKNTLYYSHPDDYYSRGKMTIVSSKEFNLKGDSFLIYQGPSGYSDLGVAYDDNLYLIFENGAVEYDERLTFLKIRVEGE